jgi:hypothetical protein
VGGEKSVANTSQHLFRGWSWVSSVRLVLGHELGVRSVIFDKAKVFLFSALPTLAMLPTSSPIRRKPEFLPGLEWLGQEACNISPSGAEVKNDRTILPLLRIFSWHTA